MSATETAILAGGCFWGVEDLFRQLDGVLDTEVGYTGGRTANPVYQEVKTGATGHAEAIRIRFDPSRISYRRLLEFFFQIHDPTTLNRQGNDIGSQYRSAIFYLDAGQQKTAHDTIADFTASGVFTGKIVTEVQEAGVWYDAEAFHQDYLVKYPDGYTCHFVRPNWALPKSRT